LFVVGLHGGWAVRVVVEEEDMYLDAVRLDSDEAAREG